MRVQLRGVAAAKPKFRLITTLMIAFALVAQPLYAVASAQVAKAASATVVSGNTSEWLFNRDPDTTTPYAFTAASPQTGSGSLYVKPIGANPTDKFIAENIVKAPISSLNGISYDFKIAGNGTAASANNFYLNVYATIDNSDTYFDCRFDYVPSQGSTASYTTTSFNANDTPTRVQKKGARIGVCPSTLAGMPEGSHVRAFAINVGDTNVSDVGLAGYLDNVVVAKTSGADTYDFEPIAAPQLEAPVDDSVVNGASLTNKWSAVPGAQKYVYESYHDANATNKRWKETTTNTQKTANNVANGMVFWWRVKAVDALGGESAWSPLWKVTIDNDAPSIPMNGQPDNSVKISGFNFTWNESTDNSDVNYEFRTSQDESQIGSAPPRAVDNPTIDSVSAGVGEGVWYWQVRAVDEAGNKSGWSQVWNVRIDTVFPTLKLATPAENEVFGRNNGKEKIVVTTELADDQGLNKYNIAVDDPSTSTVAGESTGEMLVEPATLQVVVTFNAADFANGKHTIYVWVTDKAGNKTVTKRVIWIDNSPPVGGSGAVRGDTNELDRISDRLSEPFAVPTAFGTSVTPSTFGAAPADTDVLGVQKDGSDSQSEKTVAAVPTESGWKLFGIMWYWWVLLAAVLAAVTTWLVAAAKRRHAEV